MGRPAEMVITILDAISRTRALTEEESLALEKAIRQERQTKKRRDRWWSEEQDAIALELRGRRAKVDVIAKRVGRSKDAVYARIRLLTQRQSTSCVGRRG